MDTPSGWSLEPPPRRHPRRRRAPATDAFGRPQRSWIREKLGAAGAAIVALLAKLKAVLLLLPKIKLLATAGTRAGLGRRLQRDLGLAVRGRLRGPALHPRDGACGRAAPPRHQGERADVHPLHGRRDLGSLARRRRAHRGPRRPRRPAARRAPPPRSWRSSASRPTPSCSRRSATSASCSTSSTCCPSCPSTADARWPRWRRGCGSSASAALVLLEFLDPNPILLIICLVAGYDLYHRWQQRHSPTRRADRLLPRLAAQPRARRGRLPRPDRAAGGRHALHLPAPHDLA